MRDTYISALLLSASERAFIQRRGATIPGCRKFWSAHRVRSVCGRIVKQDSGNIIFGEKRESILQESHEIRFGDDFWWRERRPFISIVLE